ncbi:MAG: hypothetical protein EZS28_020200 [Streblomastix strix]|uniref:Uncharacterized protein n=1 Tax=Streblomastix strix TaxID=222440 RepID=A0A5J4VNX1_9EUKA|nr:MAG: hypothetical protein EZS28_020200 [Streblomastix strix]
MNRFLAKAIQVQGLNTIESQLEQNAVVPFNNDVEHHYSVKEIKPESQMPALFDKEIIITCGTYIKMRKIGDAIEQQTNVPYLMPVRFRISVPLDYLLIFLVFTDYTNGMFGDLKIKFKINPNVFVFAQVDPKVSLAKYYTMNMDELLSTGQQKLMDIDLFFRNCSLTFKNMKQFTQLGCIADLITSIRTEKLTQSDLKNVVCDIAPVIVSIKNYVATEVTANMAGYKATDAYLARVREFFSTGAFGAPAQRFEIYLFPTSATLTGIRTS